MKYGDVVIIYEKDKVFCWYNVDELLENQGMLDDRCGQFRIRMNPIGFRIIRIGKKSIRFQSEYQIRSEIVRIGFGLDKISDKFGFGSVRIEFRFG